MLIETAHTKKEIKAWTKDTTKKMRNKSNDFLFDLRFNINWNTESNDSRESSLSRGFIQAIQESIMHANRCGISTENSSRVMKIPIHKRNNELDNKEYNIKVGFYGEEKYDLFDKRKVRNRHIGMLQNIQITLLKLLDIKEGNETKQVR